MPFLSHAGVSLRYDRAGGGPPVLLVHGRDGSPERGAVIGRLGDGRRFLAVVRAERAVLEAMEREEQIGRAGRVSPVGGVNRYDPA